MGFLFFLRKPVSLPESILETSRGSLSFKNHTLLIYLSTVSLQELLEEGQLFEVLSGEKLTKKFTLFTTIKFEDNI